MADESAVDWVDSEGRPHFPEHEKLAKISDQSQAIYDFIEATGFYLCKWDAGTERFVPDQRPIKAVLAEHFNIDLERIDAEKSTMLRQMRQASTGT